MVRPPTGIEPAAEPIVPIIALCGVNQRMEAHLVARILGALIGAEVGKQRRGSGLKGAVVGMATVGLLRRMGPLGLVIGGAYTAKKMYDRHKAASSPKP